MTDGPERVQEADFPGQVAAVRGAITDLTGDAIRLMERDNPGLLAWVEAALSRVLAVTSMAPAEVIPTSAIQGLTAGVVNLGTTIPLADSAPGQAGTAIRQRLEELLSQLWLWHSADDDLSARVTKAGDAFRRSTNQQVRSLRGDLRKLTDEATAVRAAVEQDQERSQGSTGAISEAVSALASQAERHVQRMDDAITGLQTQYAQVLTEQAANFADVLRQREGEMQFQIARQRDNAKSQMTELKQQVNEAKDLVSVFAAGGTANAYGTEATNQASAANWWRVTAVLLGIVAAATASTTLWLHSASADRWTELVGKTLLTVVLGGISTYAARQSARHRRREEHARQLELDLVAFGPFIRDLPKEARQTAREELVTRLFAREIGADQPGSSPIGLTDADLNIIGRLFDLVKKLR